MPSFLSLSLVSTGHSLLKAFEYKHHLLTLSFPFSVPQMSTEPTLASRLTSQGSRACQGCLLPTRLCPAMMMTRICTMTTPLLWSSLASLSTGEASGSPSIIPMTTSITKSATDVQSTMAKSATFTSEASPPMTTWSPLGQQVSLASITPSFPC